METRFFIIVPHLQNFEPSSGTSIRIAGYTSALNELKIDYRFLSSIRPSFVPPEKHEIQQTHRRWTKILLVHNVLQASHWFWTLSYFLRIIIRNFAKIDHLSNKIGNRIIWSHQDNTIAMYLYLVYGKLFIYDIHGILSLQREYLSDLNLWRQIWFNWFIRHENLVLREAPFINVVSMPMKKYIENTFSPKGKIFVAPDAIPASLERYFENKIDSIISKKYNLPFDAKVILFAGSLKRIGGVSELVKVFIEDKYIQSVAILLLIGNGQEETHISKLVNSSGCSSRVFRIISLPHNELILLMKEADVIVCPDIASNYYNEITPHIKLFDAIASGRNVVATDFKVNKELFDPNVFNIFYFSYTVKNSFNEALIKALNCSPKKYKRSHLEKFTYMWQAKKFLCNFK